MDVRCGGDWLKEKRMLKIEFVDVPRNGIEVQGLPIGAIFKVPRGKTPYIKIYGWRVNKIECDNGDIAAVSLDSGNVRWFDEKHIVQELEGVLTVHVDRMGDAR